MVVDKLLPILSQNLLEILDDEEYYDITIEVGNDPYVKIFRSHMVILYYRSSYLKRILSTNKKRNDETLVHIKLPNILPEIFQIILRYIYSGTLSLEEYDDSDIIKILVTASELGLQELITYLQSFLIENKSRWMELNFNLIYQISFENNSFLRLQKYCTDLIFKEPDKIFKSLNFSSISEKLLITIIQSDNLQMIEIQVWENVLKWGYAQNPELPSDLASFSKEDFKALKNSLQKCVPFIRFYNLTSEEFSDKVLPYRKILPKELLYDDLLKYFLNDQSIKKSKPRQSRIDKEKFESYNVVAEKEDSDAHKGIGTEVNKSKSFELYKDATAQLIRSRSPGKCDEEIDEQLATEEEARRAEEEAYERNRIAATEAAIAKGLIQPDQVPANNRNTFFTVDDDGGDYGQVTDSSRTVYPMNLGGRSSSSRRNASTDKSSYTIDGGPTDEEVLIEIRQILQNANLMNITKKQVREQLTTVFNMDMTSRREFINESIMLILEGRI